MQSYKTPAKLCFANKIRSKQRNSRAMGGTEAFPDLGKHCQLADCRQLDFLPFTCDGCRKVFCVDHRSYSSHGCRQEDTKSRKVAICGVCSMAVETTGCSDATAMELVEQHARSVACDPRNKKKATCAVKRCKEVLTFSNSFTCKACRMKVCIRHRFEADHACRRIDVGQPNEQFLTALTLRNGTDCHTKERASPSPTPTVSVC